jgi:hypothetical protein
VNAAVADLGRDFKKRRDPTEVAARELLSRSMHFHGRADRFDFRRQDDVLVIEGVVPTFYLKQMLQSLLRNLENIRRVDNRVTVTCCNGLSDTAR